MKTYLITIIATSCLVWTLLPIAGNTQPIKLYSKDSIPTLIQFEKNTNQFSKTTRTSKQNHAKEVMISHLNLPANEAPIFQDSLVDEQGNAHLRFFQSYKGVKIEGSQYNVHYKKNDIESMNGDFRKIKNINLNIQITEQQALEKALEYVNAQEYMWDNSENEVWIKKERNDKNASFYPKAERVIYTNGKGCTTLTYKFNIYAHIPLRRDYIYVNAQNGQIEGCEPIIKNIGATGTAQTRYNGQRNVNTDYINGTYRLRDYTRGKGIETYNLRNSTNFSSATDFTDIDNNWTQAEWHNAKKDDAALDAHWGSAMTYDYFKNKHNRNSFDNKGTILKNYVHYSTAYDNAFWDGERMVYGDGGIQFDVLTSIDVIAHEIGHGICQSTANLAYNKESGALNEGFSDIWGACVEYYARPEKNDNIWLIGEDIASYSGALRYMNYPKQKWQPNTYGGIYWYGQNCSPNSNNDYCGVHTNSGILNYWFYLLSSGGNGTNDIGNGYSVMGIGIEKAAKISYRTLAYYLTPNSNYSDARLYTIKAAEDLFGAGSNEVVQTTNAWYAVGIGNPHQYLISGPNNPYSFQQVDYHLGCFESGISINWSGSSNVQFHNGQTGTTVAVLFCGGSTATLTATLSGTVNQTFTKTIQINNGNLSVYPGLTSMEAYLEHPYAQCYDWKISSNLTSQLGNGTITCSNQASTIIERLSYGYNNGIEVRAQANGCYTPWKVTYFQTWQPQIDNGASYLNPMSGEPFYASLVEPFPGYAEYYWYFDSNLFAVTSEPSIHSYDWPCGMYNFRVIVGGVETGTDFWGMCGGWHYYSYPNPTNDQLTVEIKEEANQNTMQAKTMSTTTLNSTQSQSRKGIGEVALKLYNSQQQLVRSQTIGNGTNQASINTSGLANGTYFLNIIKDNKVVDRQTIIVRH